MRYDCAEEVVSGTETFNDRRRKMSEATTDESQRRVLLVADKGTEVDSLRTRLSEAGYAADSSDVESVIPFCIDKEFEPRAPSAVLLVFGEREGEGRLVALARRLRSEPSCFALPVLFLFREDSRSLRSSAQHFGADDYFTQDATAEELRARLASLLWRVEAGRRSAPAVADQRSEIDNFLFLLDAVSAEARAGATGSLALVVAGDENINDAHGFLKLNLRRLDAVAFYGPATLLVYLHGADGPSAHATLSRLRAEFAAARRGGELFVGISSFPAHGAEVERLVEQAEVALNDARGENSAARVVVYGFAEAGDGDERDAERRTQRMRAAGNEPAAVQPSGVLRTGGKLRHVML